MPLTLRKRSTRLAFAATSGLVIATLGFLPGKVSTPYKPHLAGM